MLTCVWLAQAGRTETQRYWSRFCDQHFLTVLPASRSRILVIAKVWAACYGCGLVRVQTPGGHKQTWAVGGMIAITAAACSQLATALRDHAEKEDYAKLKSMLDFAAAALKDLDERQQRYLISGAHARSLRRFGGLLVQRHREVVEAKDSGCQDQLSQIDKWFWSAFVLALVSQLVLTRIWCYRAHGTFSLPE